MVYEGMDVRVDFEKTSLPRKDNNQLHQVSILVDARVRIDPRLCVLNHPAHTGMTRYLSSNVIVSIFRWFMRVKRLLYGTLGAKRTLGLL